LSRRIGRRHEGFRHQPFYCRASRRHLCLVHRGEGDLPLRGKSLSVRLLLYVSYLISGFLAKPDWNNALVAMVKPNFKFQIGYLVVLVGLVGTTIAPWMQF
jgi:hypothetical protein